MKKRILIADDNEGILDALQIMMHNAGYEVETSPDGKVLLADRAQWPDLILLDSRMSGLDGRDICKHLKANKKTKNIPVIIISASHDLEASAKAAGADEFIPKPFSMHQLLNSVSSLLKNGEQHKYH